MQRELVDIVLEAVGCLPELPESLVTALVEGAHALTGGTRNYRPLTAGETEAVVKYLKGNAARIGADFDEKEIRALIAKNPGRFQQTLSNIRKHREMLSQGEQNARQQHAVDRKKAIEESKTIRYRYYAALVARLKKSFAYFNIPFDETKAMTEIDGDDHRWLSSNILTTADKNPNFTSLGVAMKNPVCAFLRAKNPALGKFIQDAFSFTRMREVDLERMKSEYGYMREGQAAAASKPNGTPDMRGENIQYNNQIAPWFGEGKSIGEVAVKCPGIPYSYLYAYFVDHGAADRLQNAPKPEEDLMSFLTRLSRGDASEMDFTEELYRAVVAAYGGANVETIIKGFASKHKKEYDAALEKCSHGWVKPKALSVYAVWTMLH